MKLKRLRFIALILVNQPAILIGYSPLMIALTIIGVATPFATGRFIDSLAYRRPFLVSFVSLAVLLLAKVALNPLLQRFISARSRTIETDLQLRVLDAAMDMEPAQLAATENGGLVAKLTRDAYAVGSFVRGFYPQLLQAVVTMFATGCALFVRAPALSLAFVAFFPLAILLFSPFARRFAENSHRVRQNCDRSFNTLFDFLFTLPLLRTLDAERRFADAPRTALSHLQDGNRETDALSVRFGALLAILLVGGEIAVLGFAGTLAAKGMIPVGDVVLYQLLFITAIQSVQGVIGLLPELTGLCEGADSLAEMLDHESPVRRRDAIAPLEALSFDHVTFAYPKNPDHPVVRDFSFTLRPGTVVGLFGANGSGKSTLLKLAVGALEPQAGAVRYNSTPLTDINLHRFRDRIGIVFQDNLIVSGTIRDNLTLRDPSVTSADIDRALAVSGFDAVVRRLPDGLETLVGNHMRTLSGGERQRLAIARAVVRDPFILVLDEATNHLDVESRKQVAELITKLRPGRLILIAGHDPELDRLCDLKIPCQNS